MELSNSNGISCIKLFYLLPDRWLFDDIVDADVISAFTRKIIVDNSFPNFTRISAFLSELCLSCIGVTL